MSISIKTSESLDLLVGKAFDLNRSFDRAVSIMKQLNANGVVGEENGAEPRTVLMDKNTFEKFLKAKGYL